MNTQVDVWDGIEGAGSASARLNRRTRPVGSKMVGSNIGGSKLEASLSVAARQALSCGEHEVALSLALMLERLRVRRSY